MDTFGPAVFLLARLLLMSPQGTDLVTEQHAKVPLGGAGLVRQTLAIEGMPGAIRIRLAPQRTAPTKIAGDAGGEKPEGDSPGASLTVGVRADLWTNAASAKAGRPPDESNRETVEIGVGSSVLVQIAEDPDTGRRLMLSLSSPPEPPPTVEPPSTATKPPRAIAFRVIAYRGTPDARTLIERHNLITLEGRPVTWESRWKKPIPREDGKGIRFRDEGLSLEILPVLADSGWVSVEADLSGLIYPPDGSDPLKPSSSVTRTVAMGIPFEITLPLPAAATEGLSDDATAEKPQSLIVEIVPYRPNE